jgi:hypothetical protein
MSLGLSASSSASQATKQSTGPVTFGGVSVVAPGAKQSTWLWAALGAAAAAIVALLFFRKS